MIYLDWFGTTYETPDPYALIKGWSINMNEKKLKQINALQCAVCVMDGTAGGYTKEQIQQSKVVVMEMIAEMEHPK
jgi:hypothetical protein